MGGVVDGVGGRAVLPDGARQGGRRGQLHHPAGVCRCAAAKCTAPYLALPCKWFCVLNADQVCALCTSATRRSAEKKTRSRRLEGIMEAPGYLCLCPGCFSRKVAVGGGGIGRPGRRLCPSTSWGVVFRGGECSGTLPGARGAGGPKEPIFKGNEPTLSRQSGLA